MDSIPRPPNPFLAAPPDGGYQLPSLQELFVLPGDWVLYLISTYAPSVHALLGLRPGDYATSYSVFAAVLVWFAVSLLSIVVCAAVRDADRAVTRGLVDLGRAVRRRVRMAVALAAHRRRSRATRAAPAPVDHELRPSADSHLYE
jgi:hypothetical protein